MARAFATANAKHSIQVLGATFEITFDLPFSWKVFYFSATAIATGTTIYAVYCPSIIRDSSDYSNFIDREGASQLMLRIPVAQNARIYGRHDELTTFVAQLCVPNRNASESERIPINHNTILTDFEVESAKLPDAFQMTRALVSRWHPAARVCCGVSYLIGFVLLGWVFVDSFLFVANFAA